MKKLLLMTSSVLWTLASSQPLWSMEEDIRGETSVIPSRITQGNVQLEAGPLAYRDSGGNGPVVLCIHGNSTGGWLFEKLMKENTDIRFLAFDSPGHGDSFRASAQLEEEIYSFPGCASTLLEALNKFDSKIKEFSILGVSKGGHEAINLYAQASDRVKSLILSGTPPLPHFHSQEHAGQILSTAFKAIPAGALTGKAENFTEEEAQLYLAANGLTSDVFNPTDYRKVIDAAMKTDGRARGLMFKSALANQRVDEVKTLMEAKIPVLILGGEKDAFINYDYVKGIKWPSPSEVEMQILAGEDHSFVWNNPNLFSEFMRKHLAKNHTLPSKL